MDFASLGPARVAALFGRKDQLFAIGVVVLSAKLAKCDGPVKRAEIDAFKRQFRIPPESVRDIGRLFDQARDSAEGFETYAAQLGEAFADNRGMLEDVLAALFVDRPRRWAGKRAASSISSPARIAPSVSIERPGTGRAARFLASRKTPDSPTPMPYSASPDPQPTSRFARRGAG